MGFEFGFVVTIFSPLFTPPLVAEPLLVEVPGIIGDSIEIMAQFLSIEVARIIVEISGAAGEDRFGILWSCPFVTLLTQNAVLVEGLRMKVSVTALQWPKQAGPS